MEKMDHLAGLSRPKSALARRLECLFKMFQNCRTFTIRIHTDRDWDGLRTSRGSLQDRA